MYTRKMLQVDVLSLGNKIENAADTVKEKLLDMRKFNDYKNQFHMFLVVASEASRNFLNIKISSGIFMSKFGVHLAFSMYEHSMQA